MKILNMALISSTLFMSGAAAAQDSAHARPTASADQSYAVHASPYQALAPSNDSAAGFDPKATSGRMGQGASPLHPEGPGNLSN